MQDRPAGQTNRFVSWTMAVLVFTLVFICYWPALRGGLVWDDDAHVSRPELRTWAGLGRIWFELQATQQYYPILHSAFWVEHRLWGDATLGYHLVNVFLHASACCLLAMVLQRLWRVDPVATAGAAGANRAMDLAPGAAWLAAAIFAVHPVCVESVAWIAEQKNTLSLVLYLLAGAVYLDFNARRSAWSYGLALVFFGLALGTKSVTATLPAALLVLLWWRHGRLGWRRDIVPLMPWFVVAVAAGLFTAWVERKLIGAEGAAFNLSLVQRLLLAGRIVWFYVGKVMWPADLMFIYPRWDMANSAGWVGWLGGALVVTAALWWLRRRMRGPLAAWLFFGGSLFPVLGFFNVYPFVFAYVADHFQYLASLGLITGAALGTARYLDGVAPRLRTLGWFACGLLVGGLAVLANRQSSIYVDGETLYRATLARNPACWMAHNNLAVILAKSPKGEAEAEAHYREALRLKPDYAEAHNNLAVELTKRPGREAEAIAHCEQALRIHPDYPEAHCNLANVLVTIPGREPEALAHYEEALHYRPADPEIHFCLANALAKSPGRLSAALAQYEEALRLNPEFIQAHVNFGNQLARLPGHRDEALAHFQQALRLDPGLAEVHYNWAVQVAALPGREGEAVEHYLEALRLSPGYAKAHNNLAVLYARQGRLEEARKHWEKALALNPNYEDARRNLELLQKRTNP